MCRLAPPARALLAALAAVALAASVAAAAAAQDASPVVAACTAPPSAAGSAAAGDALPPVAGTPAAAEPAGTPVPTPAPVGAPADRATADRVTAAERNLIACLNAGAYDVVIALHAPEALPRLFGTADPAAAAALLAGFPPVEILAVEDVQVLADGRISAEVTALVGGAPERTRDYWVERGGFLRFDDYATLPGGAGTPVP